MKKGTKSYDLVSVVWEDANVVSEWSDPETISTAPILSFGILLRKDRRAVVVAQSVSIDKEGGPAADAIAIPLPMVRGMKMIGRSVLPRTLTVKELPPHNAKKILGRKR